MTIKQRRWWAIQPARSDTVAISTRRAYTEVLTVFGVFFGASIAAAAFSVGGSSLSGNVAGWREAVPGSVDQVAGTVLVIGVPVLLAQRRQLTQRDLGLTVRDRITLRVGIRMAAWAVLALTVAGIITSALASGNYSEGRFSYPDLTLNLFHAAQAGFIEEIVVLAFVVTTLEQARRPLREIVLVALLLRASYHIYYGPGVVGVFVWASIFLWLFLRFRTIVPLIVVHSVWDVGITFARHWKAVGGFFALCILALLIAAFILWIVDRSDAQQRRGLRLPPPGWYPDPSGLPEWRWWDGNNWTSHSGRSEN
jgi:hypothetical protein